MHHAQMLNATPLVIVPPGEPVPPVIFVIYHKTGHNLANGLIRYLWQHQLVCSSSLLLCRTRVSSPLRADAGGVRGWQIQTVPHSGGTHEFFMACANRHDWTLRFDKSSSTRASCGPAHRCLPTTDDWPVRWVFKVSEPLLACDDMATHFGGASEVNRRPSSFAARRVSASTAWTDSRLVVRRRQRSRWRLRWFTSCATPSTPPSLATSTTARCVRRPSES
jgi:hypothetical protein